VYNEKIELSAQDILDKEFKVDARGYRPLEVDNFLDTVISDYTTFNAIIKRQEREIKALTEDNIKLKQEYHKLRSRLDAASDNASLNSVNNVDLLRRISQLEKIVFEKNE
jgi:DivIVA domain-containing protein